MFEKYKGKPVSTQINKKMLPINEINFDRVEEFNKIIIGESNESLFYSNVYSYSNMNLYNNNNRIDSYGIKYFTEDMKPQKDELKCLRVCHKK